MLNFCFLIVAYLVVASDYMTSNYGDIFGYGDELLSLILLLAAVLEIVKKPVLLTCNEIRVAKILFVVMLFGGGGSIVFGYQDFLPSLVDFFVFIKAFVAYFSTRVALANENIFINRELILKLLRSVVLILFLIILVDQLVGLFPKQESFFLGFSESELWFVHSSRLAFACTMLFCSIFAFSRPVDGKIWAILALLAGVFTFKQKFISFAVISVFFLYWEKDIKKIGGKAVWAMFFLMGCATILSLEKINFYFSDESFISGFARAVLTRVSFYVADDHFPLGSGFGTFGTHVSGVNYSDLYFVYGIDNVFGLTREEPMFVTDVYWPMVLAQFGYFGVVLMFFVFILLIIEYARLFNESADSQSRRLSLSMLFIIGALLVDTTADQIVSQNRGVVAMFMIAVFANARAKMANDLV